MCDSFYNEEQKGGGGVQHILCDVPQIYKMHMQDSIFTFQNLQVFLEILYRAQGHASFLCDVLSDGAILVERCFMLKAMTIQYNSEFIPPCHISRDVDPI